MLSYKTFTPVLQLIRKIKATALEKIRYPHLKNYSMDYRDHYFPGPSSVCIDPRSCSSELCQGKSC